MSAVPDPIDPNHAAPTEPVGEDESPTAEGIPPQEPPPPEATLSPPTDSASLTTSPARRGLLNRVFAGRARRDAQLQTLQSGYLDMLTMMRSITEHLDRQSQNQQQLANALQHFPDAVEGLRAVGQSTQQQTEVLGMVKDQLETNALHEKEFVGSMNNFNSTLNIMDETSRSTTQTISGLVDRSKESEQVLRDLMDRSEQQMERSEGRLAKITAFMGLITLAAIGFATFAMLNAGKQAAPALPPPEPAPVVTLSAEPAPDAPEAAAVDEPVAPEPEATPEVDPAPDVPPAPIEDSVAEAETALEEALAEEALPTELEAAAMDTEIEAEAMTEEPKAALEEAMPDAEGLAEESAEAVGDRVEDAADATAISVEDLADAAERATPPDATEAATEAVAEDEPAADTEGEPMPEDEPAPEEVPAADEAEATEAGPEETEGADAEAAADAEVEAAGDDGAEALSEAGDSDRPGVKGVVRRMFSFIGDGEPPAEGETVDGETVEGEAVESADAPALEAEPADAAADAE